ncbi:UNVERIFIED_CONTAM: hypothetical protein FKN15_061210 [Acipenser sinensis]
MLWSPKFSLSNIHVKLTAKGLLRNLQLLSGCKKSTVVFQTVNTATSCDKLEREKDELRTAFEAVLQKVQEQHQSELADLEERLKDFYLAEWEKVHEAYQEQAEKLKTQLQQQVCYF